MVDDSAYFNLTEHYCFVHDIIKLQLFHKKKFIIDRNLKNQKKLAKSIEIFQKLLKDKHPCAALSLAFDLKKRKEIKIMKNFCKNCL